MLEQVPPFRQYTGGGWVTAEYAMLPRATETRQAREGQGGRVGGRTYEIQRLIGRSLRAVMDLAALGERTVILDCDVLQADGGTRTAAITGAFVALALALERLRRLDLLEALPLKDQVAAVSVGLVAGRLLLDLSYDEDSQAAGGRQFRGHGPGRVGGGAGHGRRRALSPRPGSARCWSWPRRAFRRSIAFRKQP